MKVGQSIFAVVISFALFHSGIAAPEEVTDEQLEFRYRKVTQ